MMRDHQVGGTKEAKTFTSEIRSWSVMGLHTLFHVKILYLSYSVSSLLALTFTLIPGMVDITIIPVWKDQEKKVYF